MSKLKHVVRHEFRLTAANKAYVILTILGPFLIFAVTVLPSLLTQSPGSLAAGKPIAIYQAPEALRSALSASFAAMEITVEQVDDEAAAKQSVLSGERVGLLSVGQGWPETGGAVWYSKSGSEVALYGTAQAALESTAR